jgi:hypothetical protein
VSGGGDLWASSASLFHCVKSASESVRGCAEEGEEERIQREGAGFLHHAGIDGVRQRSPRTPASNSCSPAQNFEGKRKRTRKGSGGFEGEAEAGF